MNAPNPDAKRVNMAQMFRNMQDELPALLEYERLKAKLARAKYLALVAEGFTEPQAIELTKGTA